MTKKLTTSLSVIIGMGALVALFLVALGNHSTLSAQVGALPDYRIRNVGSSPSGMTVGSIASFTATVRNQGTAAGGGDSFTRLTLKGPNNYSLVLSPDQTTTSLTPNTDQIETWTGWTAPAAGTYRMTACADVTGAITESKDTNNCMSVTFTVNPPVCGPNDPPSITLLYPNGGETFNAGQQIDVKWASCNISQDVTLQIHYVDALGQVQTGIVLVNSTSSSDGIERVVLPSPLPATSYTRLWKISVKEFPAGLDDFSDTPFTILPVSSTLPSGQAHLPEYVMRGIGYGGAGQPTAGTPLTITGTVKNVGHIAATASSLMQATITGPNSYNVTLTPDQTTTALAKDATQTETWTGTSRWTPPSAGTYTLKICADIDTQGNGIGAIDEIYENNNCISKSVTVNPGAVAQCSGTPFQDGQGTITNPYQICNCQQLQNMKNYLSSNFILTQDINCDMTHQWNFGDHDGNSSTSNQYMGFEAVGMFPDPFTGTLDGQNKKISKLYINNMLTHVSQGLFNFTDGAIIKNITLTDANITGYTRAGALVGFANSQTSISNAHSSGNIMAVEFAGGLVGELEGQSTVTNSSSAARVVGDEQTFPGINNGIGGLIGHIHLSSLSNSHATGTVEGQTAVGGLVGVLEQGTVTTSHANGNIKGLDEDAGGLVGKATKSSSISRSYAIGVVNGLDSVGGLVGGMNYNTTVSNSYAHGNVSGRYSIGGLVGNSDQSTIQNSYSKGSVSGNGFFGGLVGTLNASVCTSSYWDTTTSAQTTSACGVGRDTTQMNTQATFAGWSFGVIWDIIINVNSSYPYLL